MPKYSNYSTKSDNINNQPEKARLLARAMFKAYLEAADLGYKATRFLQMIDEYGGIGTAKKLLASEEFVQDGVTRLWKLGRLDLSVEALVLRPEYRDLFSDEEIKTAQNRLNKLGYIVKYTQIEADADTIQKRMEKAYNILFNEAENKERDIKNK